MGDNPVQGRAEEWTCRPAVTQDDDQGAFVDFVPDIPKRGISCPGRQKFRSWMEMAVDMG